MPRLSLSLLFLVSVALGAGACLDQGADLGDTTSALERQGCVCPALYNPVCGVDGQTYSNACAASCAQVSTAHVGECVVEEPSCVCPQHYDPVCGADGQTYSNGCSAACANVATVHAGECEVEEPSCMCPAVYNPVCGANGQTYSNTCAAACAQVTAIHDGECGVAGDPCGGLAGRACVEGNKCRYGDSQFEIAPHPDAAGECVAASYCDADADCDGFPNVHVPGRWACGNNTCGWQTRPSWFAVTGWRFSSGRPYARNARLSKELVLPEGAARGRLVNLGAFNLERGYDVLEVFTWRNGQWVRVANLTGNLASTTSVDLVGARHMIRFTSDRSRELDGFDLVAEFRWF